ncbi:hypothetical protein RISK_001546 [Rhodopirellula islandica]|uniref:Uncharacterized protein n=1 Tax=Rhodopirellula islandica TaxID=595434 RepID=A0A0J1BIG5_RHOIS|nr:hypothetical protein RISK_001546 [Rhodopirellula islandica]
MWNVSILTLAERVDAAAMTTRLNEKGTFTSSIRRFSSPFGSNPSGSLGKSCRSAEMNGLRPPHHPLRPTKRRHCQGVC